MYKLVIADSSCLIGLSRIGKLEVLRELFGKIVIPEAVYMEVVIRGEGRKGAEEVKKAIWIEKKKVKDELAVKAIKINLGIGESEAIVLAAECNADFIILHDLKARQTAEEFSLEVIGTVAILKKAQEKEIIENLPIILENLRNAGFYFMF